MSAEEDPGAEFLKAMARLGLAPKESIRADGRLHRFDVDGDRPGSRNGFYTLHLDGRAAGAFGCWKRGIKETWKANGVPLTDFERAALIKKFEADGRSRDREEAKRHKAVAEAAARLWGAYEAAPADHPYLTQKQVRPRGARIDGQGRLVLSTSDVDGALWSLQTIDQHGAKLFLYEGRKHGCMMFIGDPSDRMVIAEGFATGASIHESTGLCVAVAFDGGNLEPVARAIHAKWPKAQIVIAADDDRETKGPINNPGLHYASRAAEAVGAGVAVPIFREPKGRKDFNDLAISEGMTAVAAIILGAFPEPDTGWPEELAPLILDPSDPLPSAARFVDLHHDHRLGRTLHRHGGSFWVYSGTHYRELSAEELRADLYPFLADAQRRVRNAKTGEFELAPFKPTTNKVSQVVDALAAHTFLPVSYAMPAWLDDRAGLPPRELVPLANGLLHLPTGQLAPHTPQYFGGYSLPFTYDPAAGKPEEWLRFLDSVWPDDLEARGTLQELMGLLLTPETRYQKLFLMVGPKRSGKGTVGRVIRAMLGACNVAGPTLSGLATNFGLQPLIGKPAAIISDARLSGRADATVIAERLLSISGEDAITVDRKHVEPWTGTLPTRFVILTNELPRIADASGALASRFIVLTMRESFFGREDHGLTDRLIAELPGIFNWAVAGWKRLAERGHFVMPASSVEALEDIESLSSPMLAFLGARCVVRPGVEVPCDEIFEEWCGWCKSEGRDHTGTSQSFGRDLKAAVSGIKVRQPRWEGQQRRVYVGVGLRSVSDSGPLTRDDTRDSHCSALFIADGDEGTKRSQWGVGNSEEKSVRSGVTRVSSRVIADVDDEEIVL